MQADAKELAEIAKLVALGNVKPYVQRIFPLDVAASRQARAQVTKIEVADVQDCHRDGACQGARRKRVMPDTDFAANTLKRPRTEKFSLF